MGKIKPTRIVTPRIVQPHRGGFRPWLWLSLLAALALWSWQVFEFARQPDGLSVVWQHDRVEAGLHRRIEQLEEERDALRAAAAEFEQASQVDRAAADGVKAEVKALQDERAELQREVAFLRSLIAGGDTKLVLNDHSLTALGDRLYRFEVTLAKRTDDQATVSGQVVISVRGRGEGGPRVLDMGRLTDGRNSGIDIHFKSFQRLKTELQLPEGFVPSSIRVAVKPEGKVFKSFERAYDWKMSDA